MARITIPPGQEIVTREQAQELGLTRYRTGDPCRAGHLDERMVSNRTCCSCLRQKTAKRKSRQENRERMNARRRLNRVLNPEPAKIRRREYYAKNRGKLAARMRQYRKTNAERVRTSKAKTYKKTYDKILARNHTRRAREKKATGKHTAADIQAIRKMQGDKCAICRVSLKGKGTRDHIVALAQGGSNDKRNLQLLCQPCNSKKNAKDSIEHMQSLGYLL